AKFGANGGDGSFGTGNGQFNTPRSVSAVGTQLWVADTGNDRLQAFTYGGGTTVTFLGATGAKAVADGLLNTPRGVSVTAQDQYVAASGNHRIDVFGSSALLKSAAQPSGLTSAPAPGEGAGLPLEVELLPLGSDPRDLTAVARFQLASSGNVRVVLEDGDGAELRVVHDGELSAGVHEVTWSVAAPGGPAGQETVSCRVETADGQALRSVALP
ncbi:MAG TPA: hypothetical protein VKU85_18340, partial [bacterium]|nr:hypothetical protein [bacterium]